MDTVDSPAIELFWKTFDVPALCYRILKMVKEPAELGRMYDVEVLSAQLQDFKLRIEFKTTEETYINLIYNLDNRAEDAIYFLGQMGASLSDLKPCIGKKYKVFYESPFSVVIINEE